MLRALGARVTGLDLSEAMLARARAKNGGPGPPHRAYLGDAERLADPDAAYDAVVARHLAWTLPDAPAAFAEWLRVLRPGGRLLVVDGDWVTLTPLGRAERWLSERLAARAGATDATGAEAEAGRDPDAHAAILARVHYRAGLTASALRGDLARARFGAFAAHDVGRVYRATLAPAPLAARLRMTAPRRFALSAARPAAPTTAVPR